MNKNIITLLLCTVFNTSLASDEIEQIVVVGATVNQEVTNISEDFTFVERIMPAMAYTPGGYGGFAGYNERGAQTVHTTIFRNGVPVNDAGSGWYDFAHDIATGLEQVKIVNGPNSVLYGSGSLGGTVFITDDIDTSVKSRIGENHTLVNANLFDSLSLTRFSVNNGSVRTDNTEDDEYKNTSAKFVKDIAGFSVVANYTDYDYDYDDCWTADWSQSNDCVQSGTRQGISIRNENFTLGYNRNQSEYYTEDVLTWDSDAERYYLDARETFEVGEPAALLTVGVTADKQTYADQDQNNTSGYAVINFENRFDLGVRVSEDAIVYRTGFTADGFFVNAGTSYRNPTLYELNGDAFVNSNLSLDPEEAFGWEIGYAGFTYFDYSFDQGIDYDFSNNQFVNTGEYETSGIRYMDSYSVPYGAFNVMLGYTDSDQPRVPEYKTQLSYLASVNGYKFKTVFTAQYDRGVDFTGNSIDDLQTVDFIVSKQFGSLDVSFTVQDVFDREFEIIPGYGAGGRNFFLTLSYK